MEVKITKPRIPYRETIRKPAKCKAIVIKANGAPGIVKCIMKIEPWYEDA